MRSHKIRNAGLLLGIGLGGLLDGIALQQFLYGGVQLGLWLATLAGVVVLWTSLRGPGPLPRGRTLAGWALVGWGAFNLVAGIVSYDWLLLLIGGIGAIALGYVIRASKEEALVERRSGFDRRSASPLR